MIVDMGAENDLAIYQTIAKFKNFNCWILLLKFSKPHEGWLTDVGRDEGNGASVEPEEAASVDPEVHGVHDQRDERCQGERRCEHLEETDSKVGTS